MLDAVFLSVLNMSITASLVTLVVLPVRFFLKKAPKIFSYALWSVVLFRLICPFSFESSIALLPINSTPISQDILYSAQPRINTGLVTVDNIVTTILPVSNIGDSVNPLQVLMHVGSIIWFAGMAAMSIYSIIQLVRLKQRLIGSTPLRDNIYLSDHISSPFVMGLIKPKVYLPSSMAKTEHTFIIAHEEYHIKRYDHIARIVSFAALTVHWFNPFVWFAFILSGKDMEMSCDEAVMRKMGTDIRAEYSESLLRFATGRKSINVTPLAFGEGDTKDRVKNVMRYKKPMFGVALVSVVICVAVIICFSVNPVRLPVDNSVNAVIPVWSQDKRNVGYPSAAEKGQPRQFHILTVDDSAPTGCDYGRTATLDTLGMLSELENMQGFTFSEATAEHAYVKFSFLDEKPESIYLRYISEDEWQTEYPIDSGNYYIKIPPTIGRYSFFADITWNDQTQETVYFSVLVDNI